MVKVVRAVGGMRALLAALALAVCLGATSSIASADPGDDDDTTADMPDANDPGIAALHEAISDRRDFMAALRTECPNNGDPKCRTAMRAIHDAFKEAQKKAIEEHHTYKQEQKKAKAEAKAKGKGKDKADAAKDKTRDSRPSPSPKPSGSPKP